MKREVAIIFVAFSYSVSAQTFSNLDFEQANLGVTGAASAVPVSSALPYWTVMIGGVQQTTVGYNVITTGTPSVSLIGPGGPLAPIDGDYSVLLQGSFPSGVAISQTATIPTGTQSLFFDAEYGGGVLAASIGNQSVPLTAVGTGSDYTIYAANVSAWAGDREQLTISALQDTSGPNNWEIDDISFSAVPEPSPLILTAVGGILFALHRRFLSRA